MKYIFFFIAMLLIFLVNSLSAEENILSIDSYGYDLKYRNVSESLNQPVAVAIVAFNRPHYFKKVLDSFEKNPESQTIPFYFFLEGGARATQEANIRIINASKLKYKEIIVRDRNFGCPKNFIDARRFMFDWCNFKKVIVHEDDMIVSPYYIRLTLNLHKWARSNYKNVGIVHCWTYCFLSRNRKEKELYSVRQGYPWWNFVSYCLDKEIWNKIKLILYEYEKFIDEIPMDPAFDRARSKPENWKNFHIMKQWAQKLVRSRPNNIKHDGPSFPQIYSSFFFRKIFEGKIFEMNNDNMNAFCLWLNGYITIETVVNRSLHIGCLGGISGYHIAVNARGKKVALHNFIKDLSITNFKISQHRALL